MAGARGRKAWRRASNKGLEEENVPWRHWLWEVILSVGRARIEG